MAIIVNIALILGLTLALALPVRAASTLTELSLEQLLETTVTTASKYEQKQNEVAGVVSVITRDEIKAFGWRTLDQALASLPGIHFTYDRLYSNMGTRGFGLPGDKNTRVQLAINGNRVNDTAFDSAAIGREFPLDLDLVERIEFIAGPGGAVYGQNAMFGVINVITRSGATVDGGELSVGGQTPQSLGEGRISWGKVLENGTNMLFSASGMHSRGEDLLMDYPGTGISGLAVDQDGARDKEFFTRILHGPVSFDFIYGNRRKDDPAASFFSDPLTSGQYVRDKSILTQLAYQDSFARNTLDVLGRLFLGQYRFTGLFSFSGVPGLGTGASNWSGGELRLLYKGVTDHKLMLGMEGQNNNRIEQTADDLTTPALDTKITDSGTRLGIYTQDEWRLSDTWSTTLGVRMDHFNNAETLFSPRAALIWQALPETTVKAMYGRAHRAPNSSERNYEDGVTQVANPTLANETIDTLELNVAQRLTRDFSVRTSIYQWTMLDIVTLGIDPVSGLTQYQSGDKLRARGVELSADKTWESGGRVRGSVSYQNVEYVNGEEPLNSPQWLGKLNLSQPLPWPGLRLGYELQYDAKCQTKEGSYVDGYLLSNLTLTASKWVPQMEVSLGVHNLFDQHYEHPASNTNWQNTLVQDGRSIWAKLDYRF